MASFKAITMIFISVLTLITCIKCDSSSEPNSEVSVTAVNQRLRNPDSASQPLTTAAEPVINVHPKPSLNQVEVELVYDKPLFPNGFIVSVMFDPNENATNCNNPMVLEKVFDSCTTFDSINRRVNCENLRPGLYCARALELLPGNEFGEVFYSDMVHLADLNGSVKEGVILSEVRHSEDDGIDATKIISISLGICCSLTVLFILRLIVVRRQNNNLHSFPSMGFVKEREEKLKLIDAVRNRAKVRVFLLYHPECSHHLEFVEYLANFLTSNNCEVSYDQNETNSIAINSASWIQNKLSGCYKILIVNSRSAFELQRSWLENKSVVVNETVSNDGNIFLSALAIIMHRTQVAFDYCNVSMLRPSYVSKADVLENICPGIQYEVPTDLNDLICNLHELDPQSIDLAAPHSELWEHCSVSYSAMSRLSRDISGANVTNARHFESTPPCQICNAPTDVMNDSYDRLLAV